MQIKMLMAEKNREKSQSARNELIKKKVRNASMKKFYESKIAALADRSLPPSLLGLLCHDAPVAKDNLETMHGRRAYVKKCLRYYTGILREIERSERKGFFRFFL